MCWGRKPGCSCFEASWSSSVVQWLFAVVTPWERHMVTFSKASRWLQCFIELWFFGMLLKSSCQFHEPAAVLQQRWLHLQRVVQTVKRRTTVNSFLFLMSLILYTRCWKGFILASWQVPNLTFLTALLGKLHRMYGYCAHQVMVLCGLQLNKAANKGEDHSLCF